jgi:hypothetical protein
VSSLFDDPHLSPENVSQKVTELMDALEQSLLTRLEMWKIIDSTQKQKLAQSRLFSPLSILNQEVNFGSVDQLTYNPNLISLLSLVFRYTLILEKVIRNQIANDNLDISKFALSPELAEHYQDLQKISSEIKMSKGEHLDAFFEKEFGKNLHLQKTDQLTNRLTLISEVILYCWEYQVPLQPPLNF